jgi:hypothetical protein
MLVKLNSASIIVGLNSVVFNIECSSLYPVTLGKTLGILEDERLDSLQLGNSGMRA